MSTRKTQQTSEELIADLEEALAIDEDALEESLKAQPDSFYRVAKALALESSRKDALKQYVDEAKASAYVDIKDQSRDDEIKLSEKEIDAKVRTDKLVVEAIDKLLRKTRLVNALEALEKSFTQRSYALKDLVELHLKNYYSDPSDGRAGARERQHMAVRRDMTRQRNARRQQSE